MFTLQSLAPTVTGDDLISRYNLILVTLANRPKNFARFLREFFSHIVVCAFQLFRTFVVPCVVNVLSICSRVRTELRPELTRVTPKNTENSLQSASWRISPQVHHGQNVLRVRESQCHIASPGASRERGAPLYIVFFISFTVYLLERVSGCCIDMSAFIFYVFATCVRVAPIHAVNCLIESFAYKVCTYTSNRAVCITSSHLP